MVILHIFTFSFENSLQVMAYLSLCINFNLEQTPAPVEEEQDDTMEEDQSQDEEEQDVQEEDETQEGDMNITDVLGDIDDLIDEAEAAMQEEEEQQKQSSSGSSDVDEVFHRNQQMDDGFRTPEQVCMVGSGNDYLNSNFVLLCNTPDK